MEIVPLFVLAQLDDGVVVGPVASIIVQLVPDSLHGIGLVQSTRSSGRHILYWTWPLVSCGLHQYAMILLGSEAVEGATSSL